MRPALPRPSRSLAYRWRQKLAKARIEPSFWRMHTTDEPAQILERKQTQANRSDGLKGALQKLDPRSRRIIEARWLKESDPATLQELADEYGVSAERIRQIESKALKQMKGALHAIA